jgi:hypothetical protein
MKRRLNEVYVKHTGQPYEMIEKTLDRDYFMSSNLIPFGRFGASMQECHTPSSRLPHCVGGRDTLSRPYNGIRGWRMRHKCVVIGLK